MIDRYSRPGMKLLWSEESKYDKWLSVELAVCEAWTSEGVIPQTDMEKLRDAQYNLDRVNAIFESTRHDMTAFTRSITERLGEEGRWIHLGLTSSDVMDTALSIQMVEASDILLQDLDNLCEVLQTRAQEHKFTLTMGRTHGIHAEPTTFGLKLDLWWDEIRRQRNRLQEAQTNIRVGKISGAVGTHATVPPTVEDRVCQRLKLNVAPFSNQIVQRDRHAHWVLTLGLIAASLEKFATEIRHLQRTEVREVEEPFGEGQTGSSAMPHKRNPELTERVCGLARLIRGHTVTALENVALWHERDISHSSAERIILADSSLALDYILDLFTGVMRNLKVFPQQMEANLELTRGLVFSQRVLLALVGKGMAREEAYHLVQDHAMESWDHGGDFRSLLRTDKQVQARFSNQELDELFDFNYYIRYVPDMFQRVGL